jgi:ABC-2 type transport system ATP-binding protein
MPVIEVSDLRRDFGDFTAVDSVSFEVEKGELFGFLGPNGAGKTTTINMLCTLLKLTSGSARVAGHDVSRERNAVRKSIGLIFQDPTLDERLTGLQNLRFHAMLYGVTRADFAIRSAELLEMVELTDKAKENVRAYSGGMKRRLEIARGLLHHPDVLFLDEPTIGLDPQTRAHIWDYLLNLRQDKGLTLFLTTHAMEEAENCDRIAIMDHGKVIALDTPDRLKAMVGGDVVTLETSDNARAATLLAEAFGVSPQVTQSGTLIIETAEGGRFIPHAMTALSNALEPIEVSSVALQRPTIENVFIKLTGRTIRESETTGTDRMRARRGRGMGPGRRG